jgi:hypothetical protein
MAEAKKKAKSPTKPELVKLISRLRDSLKAKDERIAALESEVAELKGPVTMVSKKTAAPRGKGGQRRKANVATFMTVTRKPKA